MNQAQLDRFSDRLNDLLDRLQSDLSEVTEGARRASGGQAAGELSNAPLHLADMGSEEYLQELTATLVANEQYLTAEVQAALDRLKNGGFGECESCGEPINPDRLDAIPYARLCLECAAAEDDEPVANLNRGRPQLPDDTLAPEGDMGEDRLSKAQAARDDDQRDGDLQAPSPERVDVHAAGTAGGGTAVGGLAGTNLGRGDPDTSLLDDATGSGNYDSRDARTSHRVRRPSRR